MKIGRKITLILLAIFFIGLSLLLYPSISSYWNSITQSKAVEDYDAMLKLSLIHISEPTRRS